jgi:hypothetical protein
VTAELARSTFEPHLNEAFRVRPAHPGAPEVDLLLVEVSGGVQGPTESFSLLFKGPFEGVFPHDIHTLSHPALGSHEVFLGPVHTGKADAIYYQAVFSRLAG